MELVRRPTLECRKPERPRKAESKRHVTAAKVRSALTNGGTPYLIAIIAAPGMRRLRILERRSALVNRLRGPP
jgi:hypothetical protein